MIPQLNTPRPEVSPELKKLRRAIIDAIDNCDEQDGETVWLELIGFLPEWRENLKRCRAEKAQASEETLERSNVFYLLSEDRITDEQATRALKLLEEREAV